MFGLCNDFARINVELNFVSLEEMAIYRYITDPDRKAMASVNASKRFAQPWEDCAFAISFISKLVCRRVSNEPFPSVKVDTDEIDVTK